MASIGMRLLEMGFGRPSGILGRLGGWLMARGNAATEQHVVDVADLKEQDVVLAVGPGPGAGLEAAASRSAQVIGLDPSEVMLAACRKRCPRLVEQGPVRLISGVAERTGLATGSVDVALAVNNVQIWPDWAAGFTELYRVLRPGGRLVLSAHEKWLPAGLAALAGAVEAAGFADIQTWTWVPDGKGAKAVQLGARRPLQRQPRGLPVESSGHAQPMSGKDHES